MQPNRLSAYQLFAIARAAETDSRALIAEGAALTGTAERKPRPRPWNEASGRTFGAHAVTTRACTGDHSPSRLHRRIRDQGNEAPSSPSRCWRYHSVPVLVRSQLTEIESASKKENAGDGPRQSLDANGHGPPHRAQGLGPQLHGGAVAGKPGN